MQRTTPPANPLSQRVNETIESLRSSNANFENAYDTYTQEYGKDKISFNEPLNLAETVDPVALILGRNCVIYYNDSNKSVRGGLGSLELKKGQVCIIGRRQPQDSVLVGWNSFGTEVDLQEYNSWSSTIPSRVHAAIIYLSEKEVMFTDLASSSGTVIVGEGLHSGPFVRIYDPGTKFPTIKFERISTSKKA